MSQMIPTALWNAVEVCFVRGESCYAISKRMGGRPSKQAILKRVRRDKWTRQPNGLVSAEHGRAGVPDLGQDTPGNRQLVCELLEGGASYVTAALVVGVSENVLRSWRKANAEFQRQCDSARGRSLLESEQAIGKAARSDWKAARTRLAAAPETADQYRPAGPAAPVIEIVLAWSRGDAPPVVPVHGVTIEHERQSAEPAAVEDRSEPAFALSEPRTRERVAPVVKTRGQIEAEKISALEKKLRAEYVAEHENETISGRFDGALT